MARGWRCYWSDWEDIGHLGWICVAKRKEWRWDLIQHFAIIELKKVEESKACCIFPLVLWLLILPLLLHLSNTNIVIIIFFVNQIAMIIWVLPINPRLHTILITSDSQPSGSNRLSRPSYCERTAWHSAMFFRNFVTGMSTSPPVLCNHTLPFPPSNPAIQNAI